MDRGMLGTFTFIVCVLFTCCTTPRIVTTPEYHYRDSVIVRTETDSIYLHDSIWVSLTSRNDTIAIEKYVVKYRDKVKIKVDTLFVTRVDTITKEVLVSDQGEKGKAASWFQILLMVAFVMLSLYSIKKSINIK